MTRLYVYFTMLDGIDKICQKQIASIRNIRSSLNSTRSKLDWDIKSADNINNILKQLVSQLDSYQKALKDYDHFLNEAYDEYVKLEYLQIDSKIMNIERLAEEAQPKSVGQIGMEVADGSIDKIAGLCSVLAKIDKDQYATDKEFTELVKTLKDLLAGDYDELCGAKVAGDVIADSEDVISSAIKDWLKKQDLPDGQLENINDNLYWFDVAGGFTSIIGDYSQVIDNIRKGKVDNYWEVASELLDSADDTVDLVNSIFETEGPGAKAVTAIVKSIAEFADTMIESGIKYNEDGSIDFGDVSKMLCESSVSALYTLVESACGHAFSDMLGVSKEDSYTFLEDMSESVGSKAGNYIAMHPDLAHKYQNSNGVGKVAMMFWASLKAR